MWSFWPIFQHWCFSAYLYTRFIRRKAAGTQKRFSLGIVILTWNTTEKTGRKFKTRQFQNIENVSIAQITKKIYEIYENLDVRLWLKITNKISTMTRPFTIVIHFHLSWRILPTNAFVLFHYHSTSVFLDATFMNAHNTMDRKHNPFLLFFLVLHSTFVDENVIGEK